MMSEKLMSKLDIKDKKLSELYEKKQNSPAKIQNQRIDPTLEDSLDFLIRGSDRIKNSKNEELKKLIRKI